MNKVRDFLHHTSIVSQGVGVYIDFFSDITHYIFVNRLCLVGTKCRFQDGPGKKQHLAVGRIFPLSHRYIHARVLSASAQHMWCLSKQ